ncbi:MAG TPA: hypothetical protein VMB71_10610 [Acetobacteraceae bacterium]|nr:hypothetical protein [Acetobacteraceae bacterium]
MKQLVALTILGLTACAERPEAIAPAYVSYLQYSDLTCPQLGQELTRLDAALTAASAQQDHARAGDTWGVLLLGLPTASLSGENIAPQIATYKGQENAMQEAMIRKNCVASIATNADPHVE